MNFRHEYSETSEPVLEHTTPTIRLQLTPTRKRTTNSQILEKEKLKGDGGAGGGTQAKTDLANLASALKFHSGYLLEEHQYVYNFSSSTLF